MEFSSGHHIGQSNKVIEDTRALQVALELSMLYMSGEQRQQQQKAESPMSVGPSMGDHGSPLQQNYSNIPNGFPEEPRNKKSQNMTECVPVPSSEHVAEIVGRQGENAKPKLYFQSYCLTLARRSAFVGNAFFGLFSLSSFVRSLFAPHIAIYRFSQALSYARTVYFQYRGQVIPAGLIVATVLAPPVPSGYFSYGFSLLPVTVCPIARYI